MSVTRDHYPSDRSQRARQLVAEGRFGGAEFGRLGGRPKKPLAPVGVGEAASEHAEEIIAALSAAIAPEQPMRTRLKAVSLWLQIEAETATDESSAT